MSCLAIEFADTDLQGLLVELNYSVNCRYSTGDQSEKQ